MSSSTEWLALAWSLCCLHKKEGEMIWTVVEILTKHNGNAVTNIDIRDGYTNHSNVRMQIPFTYGNLLKNLSYVVLFPGGKRHSRMWTSRNWQQC